MKGWDRNTDSCVRTGLCRPHATPSSPSYPPPPFTLLAERRGNSGTYKHSHTKENVHTRVFARGSQYNHDEDDDHDPFARRYDLPQLLRSKPLFSQPYSARTTSRNECKAKDSPRFSRKRRDWTSTRGLRKDFICTFQDSSGFVFFMVEHVDIRVIIEIELGLRKKEVQLISSVSIWTFYIFIEIFLQFETIDNTYEAKRLNLIKSFL